MIKIPLDAEPYSRRTVVLSGTTYILEMSYSGREDRWDLSVLTTDGTLLAVERIVPEISLLRRRPERTLPPGRLLCHREDGESDPPGLNDFDQGRASLYYFEPGDLPDTEGVT